MEDMISVIVLTYNEESTVGRALDSVLRQRCHLPVEIVVGEDGSTDGTREVCERYAKRFPRVIRLMTRAPNKGVVDNYYDCLLACRGKYIADCAGDDYWTDAEKLEKEVSILEREPDVTLVHTAWLCRDERTGETRLPPPAPFREPRTEGKRMLEAIVTQTRRPVIHSCTSLYRASTLLRAYREAPALFRDRRYECEDMQVAFALALRGRIAYLPDITLSYGVRADSASNGDAAKLFRFFMGTTQLSFELCRRHGLESPRTRRFFRRRVFALKMHAFRARDRRLSLLAERRRREWQVRRTPSMALVDAVTSHDITWRVALALRRLVTGRK